MNAADIIDEIKQLPPIEQQRVLTFVRDLDKAGRLSGKELADLAQGMADAGDDATAAELKDQIVSGFYGDKDDA